MSEVAWPLDRAGGGGYFFIASGYAVNGAFLTSNSSFLDFNIDGVDHRGSPAHRWLGVDGRKGVDAVRLFGVGVGVDEDEGSSHVSPVAIFTYRSPADAHPAMTNNSFGGVHMRGGMPEILQAYFLSVCFD